MQSYDSLILGRYLGGAPGVAHDLSTAASKTPKTLLFWRGRRTAPASGSAYDAPPRRLRPGLIGLSLTPACASERPRALRNFLEPPPALF